MNSRVLKIEISPYLLLFLQELTITLKSTWTDKQVEFQKDLRKEDRIDPVTFTADQEWDLCKHVVTESTTQHIANVAGPKESSSRDYPLYHIKCHVRRKTHYYFWNFTMVIVRCRHNLSIYYVDLLPFFPRRQFPYINPHFLLLFQILIYALSLCTFSVDVSSPSDRLSVTLTLLLTAVAFKFVVSQSLPTISYLTLLVSWYLLHFIAAFHLWSSKWRTNSCRFSEMKDVEWTSCHY